jgi:hypothetical protein
MTGVISAWRVRRRTGSSGGMCGLGYSVGYFAAMLVMIIYSHG